MLVYMAAQFASASEMTYTVSCVVLNSTHSLTLLNSTYKKTDGSLSIDIHLNVVIYIGLNLYKCTIH